MTLNAADLRGLLQEAGVPSSAYALPRWFAAFRRPRDRTWCIERAGGEWQVYQWADGTKRHLTVATTEEAACDVLLGELGFGYLIPGIRDEPSE